MIDKGIVEPVVVGPGMVDRLDICAIPSAARFFRVGLVAVDHDEIIVVRMRLVHFFGRDTFINIKGVPVDGEVIDRLEPARVIEGAVDLPEHVFDQPADTLLSAERIHGFGIDTDLDGEPMDTLRRNAPLGEQDGGTKQQGIEDFLQIISA